MTIRIVQNGREYDATTWTVRAPANGAWSADVAIAPATDIAPGACEIAHDIRPVGGDTAAALVAGETWHGTIRHVRQADSTYLEIHAGGDGLARPTVARHWSGFTDSLEVLSTLAGDAAETADGTPVPLGSWRAKGRYLRDEVAALARWVSADGWRYTLAGAVTLSAPSWSDVDAPGDLIAAAPSWRSYQCEGLPTLAGMTVDGERIGLATYSYQGSGLPFVDLRSERLTPPIAPPLDGGTLEAVSDGRATIRLDSGLLMSDVPLWHIPGVRAVVPAGCRVIVADLGGDPRAPVAFAAPFDGQADEITMTAADRITLAAPAVDAAGAYAPVLRHGDIVQFIDVPPPIGAPVPAFTTAGITPTSFAFILLAPPILPLPAGPPGTGPSGVKA